MIGVTEFSFSAKRFLLLLTGRKQMIAVRRCRGGLHTLWKSLQSIVLWASLIQAFSQLKQVISNLLAKMLSRSHDSDPEAANQMPLSVKESIQVVQRL